MATLDFKANDKQKQAFRLLFDDIHSEIGYGWWAWWGKSYLWVVWVWMQCNKYPMTRYAFWRKELKRLKQTTLATYFKFRDDYKIPEKNRGIYNAQDSIIKFANGSEILLLDLANQPSDPLFTRLGSLELTWAFVDESAEIDELCMTILSTRVWRHNNERYKIHPKLFESFNPDKWRIYRMFYKPYKDWTLPDYRAFIPALATDNPYIPKSYIEQLEKADEVTKQRLLYGNFDYDNTPWRLFEYDKILSIFNNLKYNGEKYISADIARKGKDKCVIMIWDWFEVIDQVIFNTSTNDIIETKILELSQQYKIPMSNIIVDEDWVWWWIVDHLECIGFVNNSSAISPYWAKHNDFLKRNYANLKTQCYFELAKHVNEWKVRYSVWPNDALCDELDVVVQVDMYKDAKIRIISKEDVKAKLWRSPDFSDAMMFRFYFELLKAPVTEWEYKHITLHDSAYTFDQIDEWERMEKELKGEYDQEEESIWEDLE